MRDPRGGGQDACDLVAALPVLIIVTHTEDQHRAYGCQGRPLSETGGMSQQAALGAGASITGAGAARARLAGPTPVAPAIAARRAFAGLQLKDGSPVCHSAVAGVFPGQYLPCVGVFSAKRRPCLVPDSPRRPPSGPGCGFCGCGNATSKLSTAYPCSPSYGCHRSATNPGYTLTSTAARPRPAGAMGAVVHV